VSTIAETPDVPETPGNPGPPGIPEGAGGGSDGGAPRKAPKAPRVRTIDALRGIAILAMIEWHCADAWIVPGERDTTAFGVAQRVGGLAAPIFLALAGTSVALAAPAVLDARWMIGSIRRGLRIVLAGYALNLFAWVVDRHAWVDVANLPAIASATVGIALLAVATGDEVRGGTRARVAIGSIGGLAIAALSFFFLEMTTRNGAASLAKVDVLQGIGAALVVITIAVRTLAPLGLAARSRVLAVVAIAWSMCAVAMVGVPQSALPNWIADWIARAAPWPATTSAAFPLFPWCGYTLFGAAFGFAMRCDPKPLAHPWALPWVRANSLLFLGGIVIFALAFDESPIARRIVGRAPHLFSTFRLFMNTGAMLVFASIVSAIGSRAPRSLSWLDQVGRHSLLVYCVHLELAFGLLGSPFHRSLGWGGWTVGVALLTVAMIGLARARDEIDARRRSRSRPASPGEHS
jgi:uncharacterized membrane protein